MTLDTLPGLPTASVWETFLTLSAVLTFAVTLRLRPRMSSGLQRWKFGIRVVVSAMTTIVGVVAMLSPNLVDAPTVNNTLVPLGWALSQCGTLTISVIEYQYENREPPATAESEREFERVSRRSRHSDAAD